MNRVKPWVKALNVKFQDYEEWTTHLAENQSITYWALDKGKLRAQDYLHWAREHYKIPVLKDGYFQEEASADLYEQMKDVANWSPEMIPIDQWDSVIYIACVEPPMEVNWSFNVKYVLASARSLKQFWGHLQSGIARITKQEEQRVSSASISAEIENVAEKASVDPPPIPMLNTELEEPQEENVAPAASCEISEDAPEGLSFNTSEGANDPAADSMEAFGMEVPEGMENFANPSTIPAQDPSHEEVPDGIIAEMPEGMDFARLPAVPQPSEINQKTSSQNLGTQERNKVGDDVTPPSLSSDPPQEPADLNYDTAEAESVTQSEIAVIEEFVAPATTHAKGQNQVEAGKDSDSDPIQQSEKHPLEESSTNSNERTAKEEVASLEPETALGGEDFTGNTMTQFGISISGLNSDAAPGSVVDIDRDLPVDISSATNDVQVVAWAFNELKQCFSSSMILFFEDEKLKPWKWESLWMPSSEEAFESIDIHKPGMFRIVARTKHSYHGFVVDSPSNQNFFNNWGYQELPKHATVVPLKFDDHMAGVVLSVGEETSNTDSNLLLAERIVGEMADRLKTLSSEAA